MHEKVCACFSEVLDPKFFFLNWVAISCVVVYQLLVVLWIASTGAAVHCFFFEFRDSHVCVCVRSCSVQKRSA